jgi:hypothetical protein
MISQSEFLTKWKNQQSCILETVIGKKNIQIEKYNKFLVLYIQLGPSLFVPFICLVPLVRFSLPALPCAPCFSLFCINLKQ